MIQATTFIFNLMFCIQRAHTKNPNKSFILLIMMSIERLYANNTEYSFRSYLKKLNVETMIPLICGLTQSKVEVPIRHSNLDKNQCLFEMKYFLEYLNNSQAQQASSSSQQFKCPSCQGYVDSNSYGVDRFTYNLIGLLKAQGYNDRKQYNTKQLQYQSQTQKFYVLPAKKDVKEKYEVLGLYNSPNYGTQVMNQPQKQSIINPRFQKTINERLTILKQMVQSRAIACNEALQKFGINHQGLKVKLVTTMKQIESAAKNGMGLHHQGLLDVEQQDEKFCFGMYNLMQSTAPGNLQQSFPFCTMLVTFFPSRFIWHDFKLQEKNKDFIYNEASLCIKAMDRKQNQVFILGGFKRASGSNDPPTQSSKDFYMLEFPKGPLKMPDQDKKINVVKLPDLPFPCMSGVGCYFKEIVYLFGGVQYNSVENLVINRSIHTFQNGKWQTIPNVTLLERAEGTLYVDYADSKPCHALICGGFKFKSTSQYAYDKDQEMIHDIEVIRLSDFKVSIFKLTYGATDYRVLANRCLITSPEDSSPELLIFNGRFLGEKINTKDFKPHVLNLNIKNRTLSKHSEFSMLASYLSDRLGTNGQADMNQSQTQIILHDFQGITINSVFYTVYNRPENFQTNNPKLSVQAYMYNMTTGNNRYIPFQNTAKCKKQQEQFIGKLPKQRSETHSFQDTTLGGTNRLIQE